MMLCSLEIQYVFTKKNKKHQVINRVTSKSRYLKNIRAKEIRFSKSTERVGVIYSN